MSKTINIPELKFRLPELLNLLALKESAADAYSVAISESAEKIGCIKSVLRRLVKTRSDESFGQTREEAEELLGLISSIDSDDTDLAPVSILQAHLSSQGKNYGTYP